MELTSRGALLAQWLTEDVIEWYKSSGSSNNEKALEFVKQMDGKLLTEFCSWHIEARDIFIKLAREELAFGLIDLVNFSNAIACLMKE